MTNDELDKALNEAGHKLTAARQAAADAYQAALAVAEKARVNAIKVADDDYLSAVDAAEWEHRKAREVEREAIIEKANAEAGLDRGGKEKVVEKRALKVPAP